MQQIHPHQKLSIYPQKPKTVPEIRLKQIVHCQIRRQNKISEVHERIDKQFPCQIISSQNQEHIKSEDVFTLHGNQISIRDIQQAKEETDWEERRESNGKFQLIAKNKKKNSLCLETGELSIQTNKQLEDMSSTNLTNLSKVDHLNENQINVNDDGYKDYSYQSKQHKDDSQLYNVMRLILQNQKNIQKQIGLLRLSLSRKRTQRSTNLNTTQRKLPNTKLQVSKLKNNRLINLENQKNHKNNTVWCGKYSKKQKIKERLSLRLRESLEKKQFEMKKKGNGEIESQGNKKKNNKKNNQCLKQITHKIGNKNREDSENSSQIILQQFQKQTEKDPTLLKQLHSQLTTQTHQKVLTLIKKQNIDHHRCIVTEQLKNEFWRQVQTRKKQLQTHYLKPSHSLNISEQGYLVSTNEQQKKMKESIIGQVYQLCNKSMYK